MTSTQKQQERKSQSVHTDVPDHIVAQRLRALGEANRIRHARSQFKRDLKAGRTSIRDILLEPPESIKTMKIFELILACPKYGRNKVSKVLKHCQISPAKTVSELTERQRMELASQLKSYKFSN